MAFNTQINAWVQAVQFRAATTSQLATYNAQLGAGSTTGAVQNQIINEGYTQGAVNPVIRLYQAAFNRMPDQGGLSGYVNTLGPVVNTGGTYANTYQAIANNFANSAEFSNVYGTGINASTPIQQTTILQFYTNILQRQPSAAEVSSWLTSGLTTGQVLARFAYSDEYINKSNSFAGNFSQAEINGTLPSNAYTPLWSFTTSNPSDGASVTYTLTTNPETITVPTTAATAAIYGYATTGTATGDTFQAADVINGNTSTVTTINLTAADAIAANPVINNVQTLNVRAAAASSIVANSGYTTIGSVNSTNTMAFTGIANNATLVFNTYGAAVGGNDVSWTFASGALRSSSAAVALSLNNVGTSSSNPVVAITTAGTDRVTTINVAATGNDYIATENTNAATNAWQNVTTLNVSGSGFFKLTGASNTTGNITTINASTNTGGVNIDLKTGGNTQNVTFTGGTGNDRISFAAGAFTTNDSISMGAGTNTLAIADQAVATAGSALINAIQAATGVGILELTGTANTGNQLNGNVVGLSSYTISGAITGAAGAAGATGTIADTITGQLNSQSFKFTANQVGGAGTVAASGNVAGAAGADAVNISPNLDGGSNSLTITLGNSSAGTGASFTGGAGAALINSGANDGNGGVGLAASAFETINLTSSGAANSIVGGAAGGTATGARAGYALTVSTNGTINITGDQDISIAGINGTNANVNASALTGKLSVAMLTGNTTVTGGVANDTIYIVPDATNRAATVIGGAGTDAITLLGTDTYITTGLTTTTTAGVTTVQIGKSNHGDLITTGTGTDTVNFKAGSLANMLVVSAGTTNVVSINDFVAGQDKIGLVATTGGQTLTSITMNAAQTIATAATLTDVYAGITAIGASTAGGAANAALVTVSNGAMKGTYLYVNDATAAVSNANDMLINVTGVQGTITASDFVFA